MHALYAVFLLPTLRNIDKFTDQDESGAEDVRQLNESIHKLEIDKNTLEIEIDKSRNRNEALQTLGNESRERLLNIVNDLNEIKNKSQLDDEKAASEHESDASVNTVSEPDTNE